MSVSAAEDALKPIAPDGSDAAAASGRRSQVVWVQSEGENKANAAATRDHVAADAAADDGAGSCASSDYSDASSASSSLAPAAHAGGVRALPLTVFIVLVAAAVVGITTLVPMTASATNTARVELSNELDRVTLSIEIRVLGFLRDAARAPVVAARALQAPGFDAWNATQALPLLARTLQTCVGCSCAYYGLNATDDHYFKLCDYGRGSTPFFVQPGTSTLPNGSTVAVREERTVVNITEPVPILGPLVRTGAQFVPRAQPWWPILAAASPLSGSFAPLYQDPVSGSVVTTAGAPTFNTQSSSSLFGIFAADISFAPVVYDLGVAFRDKPNRGGVMFETNSGFVLFTSRPDPAMPANSNTRVHVRALQDGRTSRVLSWFTDAELFGPPRRIRRERFGATLGDNDAAELVPVDAAGVSLRMVIFADSDQSREALSEAFGTAVGAALAGSTVVVAGVLLAAVFGFQRPLTGMATHVNKRAMAALTGDESDSDSEEEAGEGRERCDEDALPALHELRVIRLAFDELVAELRRVRGFIPDGAFAVAAPTYYDASSPAPPCDNKKRRRKPVTTRSDEGAADEDAEEGDLCNNHDPSIVLLVNAAEDGGDIFGAELESPAESMSLSRSKEHRQHQNRHHGSSAAGSRRESESALSSIHSSSATSPIDAARSPVDGALAVARKKSFENAANNTNGGGSSGPSSRKASSRSSGALLKPPGLANVRGTSSARLEAPMAAHAGLRPSVVSVAVLEVPELPRAIVALGVRSAAVLCELVAEVVEAAAAAHHAAVEHFAGDRVVLSFNTLRASHSHRRLAVECCLAVHKAVRAIRASAGEGGRGAPTLRREDAGALPVRRRVCAAGPPTTADGSSVPAALLPAGVRAGVSSGHAVVGAVGSAGLTRFCVFSDCRGVAERNLRLCADIAAEARTHTASSTTFENSLGRQPWSDAGSPNDACAGDPTFPPRARSGESLGSGHASLRASPAPPPASVPSSRSSILPPGVPVICDGAFIPDLSHSVAFQIVDATFAAGDPATPKAGGARAVRLKVAAMRFLLDTSSSNGRGAARDDDGNDGEWMYELQRAEAANEFADINAAFLALADGEPVIARRHLRVAKSRPDAALSTVAIRRLERLVAGVSAAC